jgi:hypothetical protein
MAERKTAAQAQSKDKTASKTGADTKSESKTGTKAAASKTDTKAEAGKTESRSTATRTKEKSESPAKGKGSSGSTANERWQNVPAEDQKFLKQVGDKLSASTKRAKWISSPDDHQDRKGQSLVTRNHDVIRRWAEERQAEPATVPNTQHDDHLGVLRFNFPGYGGDNLLPVSWAEWFKTFDDRQLVFLYQENLKNGNQSNFFRFDNPYRENA